MATENQKRGQISARLAESPVTTIPRRPSLDSLPALTAATLTRRPSFERLQTQGYGIDSAGTCTSPCLHAQGASAKDPQCSSDTRGGSKWASTASSPASPATRLPSTGACQCCITVPSPCSRLSTGHWEKDRFALSAHQAASPHFKPSPKPISSPWHGITDLPWSGSTGRALLSKGNAKQLVGHLVISVVMTAALLALSLLIVTRSVNLPEMGLLRPLGDMLLIRRNAAGLLLSLNDGRSGGMGEWVERRARNATAKGSSRDQHGAMSDQEIVIRQQLVEQQWQLYKRAPFRPIEEFWRHAFDMAHDDLSSSDEEQRQTAIRAIALLSALRYDVAYNSPTATTTTTTIVDGPTPLQGVNTTSSSSSNSSSSTQMPRFVPAEALPSEDTPDSASESDADVAQWERQQEALRQQAAQERQQKLQSLLFAQSPGNNNVPSAAATAGGRAGGDDSSNAAAVAGGQVDKEGEGHKKKGKKKSKKGKKGKKTNKNKRQQE